MKTIPSIKCVIGVAEGTGDAIASSQDSFRPANSMLIQKGVAGYCLDKTWRG